MRENIIGSQKKKKKSTSVVHGESLKSSVIQIG